MTPMAAHRAVYIQLKMAGAGSMLDMVEVHIVLHTTTLPMELHG